MDIPWICGYVDKCLDIQWISIGYVDMLISRGYLPHIWVSIGYMDMWISRGYPMDVYWICGYVDKSWISSSYLSGYHWICGYVDKSWISYTDSLTAAARFRCRVGWGGVSYIHTRYQKFNYPVGFQCCQSACLKRYFLVSNG